jgi:hypothetical protein
MVFLVNATLRPLYPRERPGTHCIGGWVCLSVGLEVWGKNSPPPGFDRPTFQRAAIRYTDGAIRALLATYY